MKIILTDSVLATLGEALYRAKGNEFSGVGYVEKSGDDLIAYDVVILTTGTWGYVEIKPESLAPLVLREDAQNLRLHLHAHPMGNGIPGKHNWSWTDEEQIQTMPLGSIPEMLRWSCSIVHTPKGWVGRIDNHITKKTVHVSVEPAAKDLDRVVWPAWPAQSWLADVEEEGVDMQLEGWTKRKKRSFRKVVEELFS